MPQQTLNDNVVTYFARDDAASQWWAINTETGGRYGKQLAFLKKHVDPTGKRALDVATGQGRFAITFAQCGAKAVRAIDVSKKMIEQAQSHASRAGLLEAIQFEVGDAASVNLAANDYDIVSIMEVLVHLPDPFAVLGNLVDSLRPGGILVTNYDYTFTSKINYRIDSARAVARKLLKGRFRRDVVMHDTVQEAVAELERQRFSGGKRIVTRPRDAYRGLSKREVHDWLRELNMTVVATRAEYTRIARLPVPISIGEMVIARKSLTA